MSDAPLGLPALNGEAGLDAALREDLVVLYKHSSVCGLSTLAVREVRSFRDALPAVPVYLVDVVDQRDLAREIERRTGIRHESPQVIVLRGGEPAWTASHRGVTEAALVEAARAN